MLLDHKNVERYSLYAEIYGARRCPPMSRYLQQLLKQESRNLNNERIVINKAFIYNYHSKRKRKVIVITIYYSSENQQSFRVFNKRNENSVIKEKIPITNTFTQWNTAIKCKS